MPSLHEVQHALAIALAGGDAALAAGYVRDGSLPAAKRIAIYANNSWMAFRNSLELSFPAVARLGGTEWFSSVARRYRSAHPSRSGNLQHVGRGFPAFLAAELAGSPHAVIADVATLEWAYQEVLIAPGTAAFDIDALARIPTARYAELAFPLAPQCRLVTSPWPILAIWQANRDPARPVPTINLDAGGDRLLLRREGLEVFLHRLGEADLAFLTALAAGRSLGEATDRVMDTEPRFDVGAALGRFVRLGALASAVLPAAHTLEETIQ